MSNLLAAMLLADSGLDVFILNARGSIYSQGHIDPSFSPDNVKYWDFRLIINKQKLTISIHKFSE